MQFAGSFWHITDLHYDPWYGTPQGGISCNENVPQPGKYGDYECDSPWQLVESSVVAMRNIDSSNPAFILWSGLVQHFVFLIRDTYMYFIAVCLKKSFVMYYFSGEYLRTTVRTV